MPTPVRSCEFEGAHGWPGNEHPGPFIGDGEQQLHSEEEDDEEEEDELRTTDSEPETYMPSGKNIHAGPSHLSHAITSAGSL